MSIDCLVYVGAACAVSIGLCCLLSAPQLHSFPPGHERCRSCREVYSAETLGLCPRCYPRKDCKNAGCSKPAYFSHMFYTCGPFDYCSPQCRDQDLVQSGWAKQHSEDMLDQLRQSHKEALHREMHARGGSSMKQRSGQELSSSSPEAAEMEVSLTRADDQARVKTPPGANKPCRDVGDSSEPAPDKVRRDKEDNHSRSQPSQMGRASNVLCLDLNRQPSSRLGLIFHSHRQHGVSLVTCLLYDYHMFVTCMYLVM